MAIQKINEVYKCSICGNIVEVLEVGGGSLVCCGKEMDLLDEKTGDVGMEKHVPVVEKIKNGIIVRVGSIEHPMEEKHYIQWIEVVSEDRVLRKTLKPGDKPEKEFTIKSDEFYVRAYCNIHGLWKSENISLN